MFKINNTDTRKSIELVLAFLLLTLKTLINYIYIYFFLEKERDLKTFSGPGYLRSEDGDLINHGV